MIGSGLAVKDLALPARLLDESMIAGETTSAEPAAPDVGLLERESALAALGVALESVRVTSEGRLVLIGGEAGVGKTTLLRRFREQLGASHRVLWGGCDPLFTPRPLGPLLSVAEEVGGELADVVSRGVMPHEVVAVLAREFRSPTVFVLEDVHWADEATLDLLRLLVRRIESMPVLIVASYRDDEVNRPAIPDRARRARHERRGCEAHGRSSLADRGRAACCAAWRRCG